ncbi:MAG: hypothetical protein AB7G06_02255 [Bdellovibrionales bacterium]
MAIDLKTADHDALLAYFTDLQAGVAEDPQARLLREAAGQMTLQEICDDVRRFVDSGEFLGVVDLCAEHPGNTTPAHRRRFDDYICDNSN